MTAKSKARKKLKQGFDFFDIAGEKKRKKFQKRGSFPKRQKGLISTLEDMVMND